MLTLLRIMNVLLLLATVGCIAGTLAGLIVFVPFVAGAWVLNAVALAGYEEAARPGWTERVTPESPLEARTPPAPAAAGSAAKPDDDHATETVDALPAADVI